MSRLKDNYEKSPGYRFVKWVEGEYDPWNRQDEDKAVSGDFGNHSHELPDASGLDDSGKDITLTDSKSHMNTGFMKVEDDEDRRQNAGFTIEEERRRERIWMDRFRKLYKVVSVLICMGIITLLLVTVSYLPRIGNPSNPENNEVTQRYIEKGLTETGAVNIVTGMILDYRAFDTFGESNVLFIAACCVFILLRNETGQTGAAGRKKKEQMDSNDRVYEPKNDMILQNVASVAVPFIMIFGIYVILNGHLSPGGGFSGGAIMGAGLILYLNAFGFEKTGKIFNARTFKTVTFCALSFYCLAKSYSFFTGANHLDSGIPLGRAGDILSSGLILPLNICVGLVVACTMYAFYCMFRKGGF